MPAGRNRAITFKLRGDQKMRREITRLIRKAEDRIPGAMRMEAEKVMKESKKKFVPVDLGALVNSGLVHPVERRGKEYVVKLSYGNQAAPYALAIHEHPSDASPPSWEGKVIQFKPTGRGTKYLERPVRDAQRDFPARLIRRLKL